MTRFSKRVCFLSKNETGKPNAISNFLNLHTANVRVPSPDFSQDGIGSKGLGVNFGHQPIFGRRLQLPDLA